MKAIEDENADNRFEGKTFVLTGSLEKFTRARSFRFNRKIWRKSYLVQYLRKQVMF